MAWTTWLISRLLFEFSPTGAVLPSADVVTLSYRHYFGLAADELHVVVSEIILCVLMFYFFVDVVNAVRSSSAIGLVFSRSY